MGGAQSAGNDMDPNHNTFGFHILSGPENEITTFDKRDGSHWELFDCDDSVGEARQTVKAVCTDTSENSNCNIIFQDGVAATVVEMPPNCGPGKYSVAVALTESTNHTHLHHRLEKRGLQGSPVYDFTFDYDYSPIHKRDKSQVLVRIDYSDDPGYWSHIVSASPSKAKRDLEVETMFGGDHKRWLEYTWRKEKRSFEDKDALHKRWWSGNWIQWWDMHKKVDQEYTGIRHRVHDTFKVNIFDQDLKCPSFPEWVDELYFRSWAELTIDIQTAAGVTIIVSAQQFPSLTSPNHLSRVILVICRASMSPVPGFTPQAQLMPHCILTPKEKLASTLAKWSCSVQQTLEPDSVSLVWLPLVQTFVCLHLSQGTLHCI